MNSQHPNAVPPPPQHAIRLDAPPVLPAACNGARFAELLAVTPGLVSRWSKAGRLVTDQRGLIRVPESLLSLSRTLDPARGGKSGTGPDRPSTLDRITRLIARHTGASLSDETATTHAELQARIAALQEQVDAAFLAGQYAEADRRAARDAALQDAILAALPELSAVDIATAADRLDDLFAAIGTDEVRVLLQGGDARDAEPQFAGSYK